MPQQTSACPIPLTARYQAPRMLSAPIMAPASSDLSRKQKKVARWQIRTGRGGAIVLTPFYAKNSGVMRAVWSGELSNPNGELNFRCSFWRACTCYLKEVAHDLDPVIGIEFPLVCPYLLAICWHHPPTKQTASHQQRAQPDNYLPAGIILARIWMEFSKPWV